MNILNTIIKQKEKELKLLKKRIKKQSLISASAKRKKTLNFKSAVSKAGKLNIIGEIKRSSPSAGLLKKDFNPLAIAACYKKNGVAALSVLTDETFFGGSLSYIKLIKEKVDLPILRKDFIIDEYQIYESCVWGADAVLLIAAILPVERLKKFITLAEKLNMSALVEVHTKKDIQKALDSKARIIGVNNRDLKNFKVDLNTTKKALKFIPEGKIVVSESGIKTKKDLLYLKKAGVNAALIGEIFMKAGNLEKKLSSLLKGI